MNVYEFREGALDCVDGRPAKLDGSESYYQGYDLYYSLEQEKTHWSEKNVRNNSIEIIIGSKIPEGPQRPTQQVWQL